MDRDVMVKITEADVAIKRVAEYYKNSDVYTRECNDLDAYDFFIKEYGEDLRKIIQQGYSYYYRGYYLIACDLRLLMETDIKLVEHYFEFIPELLQASIKQKDPLVICAIGTSNGVIGKNGYHLIESFVEEYNDRIVLTDCPTGDDIRRFNKNTSSDRIKVSNRNIWIWT